MATQYERVLDYMQEFGSITSFEAFKDLGVTRLSAVIFDMKKDGVEIYGKMETCKNRYGDAVSYKRYSLKPIK